MNTLCSGLTRAKFMDDTYRKKKKKRNEEAASPVRTHGRYLPQDSQDLNYSGLTREIVGDTYRRKGGLTRANPRGIPTATPPIYQDVGEC